MKLLNTNSHWAQAITRLQRAGEDYVLLTVLGARGSTPREAGTKMVVCAAECFGTIGGGHLEQRSVALALEMLGEESQRVEYFALGPGLGQCCGGSVGVLFESFQVSCMDIMLFGAGHVGSTLVPVLQQLPCRLRWVDGRENLAGAEAGSNVTAICSDAPAMEVADMPAGSWFLIMTHNHQLDYEILRAVLDRGDAAYVGLIGSRTKWRRFQLRLEHQGYAPEAYSAVRCPVGLDQVRGKRPIEVAVSVAGELISLYSQLDPRRPTRRGPGRDELRQLAETLGEGKPL